MSEVGQTDLSRLLVSKRNESNAIVASRKRKLRELFAVATHAEGLPHDGFSKPDAPPSTQAELDFLQGNDILQYVGAID
jgi:chromatin modification-related protein VID21